MTESKPRLYQEPPFTAKARWWVFLISFVTLFLMTLLVTGVFSFSIENPRARILSISAVQGIVTFFLPAWFAWKLTSRDADREMGLSGPVTWSALFGMIILYILVTPALNFLIQWNQGIHLPDSMSAVEQKMREMEESAAATTATILNVSSVGALIVNILVIGIITGFGEESFFRGGIQQMMCASRINPHAAVWIGAFIFSAVHFQFFGFLPRLFLGAMFGYLLLWTGSLWIPVIAHAINNSSVVVVEWMTRRGIADIDSDTLGFSEETLPWLALASVIATALFIWKLKPFFFNRR